MPDRPKPTKPTGRVVIPPTRLRHRTRAGKEGFAKPSLSDARSTIQALRRLDLQTASLEALKPRIRHLMGGLAMEVPTLRVGWPVFRGVKWDDRPRNLSQLSYPPAGVVKVLQRANRPGQPRFYGSSAPSAPFFELHAQVGDQVALSRWRVTKEVAVNHLGYMPETFERLQSHQAVGRVARQMAPSLRYGPADKLVHNFLAAEFTRDVPLGSEHLYKLSVVIAEIYLRGIKPLEGEEEGFAGLLYPSLAMRGNSDNVCFLPEFVDTGLGFERVDYERVEDIDADGRYVLANVDHATAAASDGLIQWLGPRSNERRVAGHTPRM